MGTAYPEYMYVSRRGGKTIIPYTFPLTTDPAYMTKWMMWVKG